MTRLRAAGWLPPLAAGLLLAGLWLLWPLPNPEGRPDDWSLTLTDKDGSLLDVFLNAGQQWQLPPGLAGPPSPKLQAALIEFEDRQFDRHWGFSLGSLLRAGWQNLTSGRVVSGGSTLTMQAVRLAWPQSRHLPAKLSELLTAIKLELCWSKAQILHLYLSRAPYGGNIRGVGAAAWKYFGSTAADMTWAEAALLAVLPNAPGLLTLGQNADQLQAKRDRLLRRLAQTGALPAADLDTALQEPLPDSLRPFPDAAPHASRLLRQNGAAGLVQTSLDLDLQAKTEALAQWHNRQLADHGIRNLAVLVAETKTGLVRAYVGSQDFAGTEGQVDGLQAPRSTGSLLKPFLYALAADRGLVGPKTQVFDLPQSFGGFSPHNADQNYAGLVTTSQALIKSLNVPAVLTLESYGVADFLAWLKQAGLGHLNRTAEGYGLPLILGGAEASPWEIAGLYRSLGSGGRLAGLTLRADQPQEPGKPLFSPGTAWQILEILRDLTRPGVQTFWRHLAGYSPLAWKTGTSYGQKDAWAAGVSPDWTVVVWAGNFSGEGNPGLSSTAGAAPLLFDVFNALPHSQGWFEAPAEQLEAVQLCADTGWQAGPDCPQPIAGQVPKGVQLQLCPWHKTIFTTADGRWRVNADSWQEGEAKSLQVLLYPAEVVQFLRLSGQPVPAVPPWKPGTVSGTGQGLALLQPSAGAQILLPVDLDGRRQPLALKAAHADPQALLFWYLDGQYLGQTSGRHSLVIPAPAPGRHSWLVVDSAGTRLTSDFTVAW